MATDTRDLHLRLPTSLYDKLCAAAQQSGETRQRYAVRALEDYLVLMPKLVKGQLTHDHHR